MNQLIADRTGQPLEQVAQDAERDFYMSAGEALQYGLVDHVILDRSSE